MKKNTFFWMKKKNFFWILVVLAAILLFFFMRRNVEGFFGTDCRSSPLDVRFCPPCYKSDGSTLKATCSTNNQCGCPTGTSTTKPTKKTTTQSCSTGHYINGKCSAVA